MRQRIWLIMKTADGGERRFSIDKPRTVIGRAPGSDLRVPLPKVNPRHCELELETGSLRLRDLGSETGTLHNGVRVEHATLEDDDSFTIGQVDFQVRFGPDDRVTEVKLGPRFQTETRIEDGGGLVRD